MWSSNPLRDSKGIQAEPAKPGIDVTDAEPAIEFLLPSSGGSANVSKLKLVKSAGMAKPGRLPMARVTGDCASAVPAQRPVVQIKHIIRFVLFNRLQ